MTTHLKHHEKIRKSTHLTNNQCSTQETVTNNKSSTLDTLEKYNADRKHEIPTMQSQIAVVKQRYATLPKSYKKRCPRKMLSQQVTNRQKDKTSFKHETLDKSNATRNPETQQEIQCRSAFNNSTLKIIVDRKPSNSK